MWAGSRRGIKVHSLEVFGALVFAVFAVFAVFVGLAVFGSPSVIRWLEVWAGELTNGALAVFALAGLLVRRPFAMPYARDTVSAEHWHSPLFIRVNYVLTAVWGRSVPVLHHHRRCRRRGDAEAVPQTEEREYVTKLWVIYDTTTAHSTAN